MLILSLPKLHRRQTWQCHRNWWVTVHCLLTATLLTRFVTRYKPFIIIIIIIVNDICIARDHSATNFPLMLSHLLVHLPPLPLRSQIALFSMPRLISGINFHFHFVNQFHLFMLTSTHPSVLHFPHPSPLHSFTLNSKLTFLVNLSPP